MARRLDENSGEQMARIFRKIQDIPYAAPTGMPQAVIKRLEARKAAQADLVPFAKRPE